MVIISLAAWLAVLLAIAGVWHVTQQPSVAPPTYDAYSYFSKFLSTSNMLSQKQLALFDAPPSIRPPGYLLINLLLNPSADPQGYRPFFFVSIIFPLFVWLIACLLAVRAAGSCQDNSLGICKSTSLLIAVPFACLPMFYAFEVGGWGYWGLVDSGLAAFAGLSAALCIRAFLSGKVYLHIMAAACAGFCLWIKPSGALVMVTIISLALCGMWLRSQSVLIYSCTGISRPAWRHVIAIYLVIYIAFTMPALASEYFSRPNFDYASEGQKTLLALYPPGVYWFIALLRDSTGYLVPTLIGTLVLTGAHFFAKKPLDLRVADWRGWLLLFAFLQFLGGALWWILAAGFQTRYMFPFVTIALVCAIPALSVCVDRSIKTKFSNLAMLALCLPPAALAAALWTSPPVSKVLQSALQIDIATGSYADAISAAKILSDRSSRLRPPVYVTCERPEAQFGVMASYTRLELQHDASSPVFLSPWKWKRGNVVDLQEIINADFIISLLSGATPSATQKLLTFEDELARVFNFIRAIKDEEVVKNTRIGDILLQQVINRSVLAQRMQVFIAQNLWRPEFLAGNADFLNLASSNVSPDTCVPLLDQHLQGRNIVATNDVKVAITKQEVDINVVGQDPYIILTPVHGMDREKITLLQLETLAISPFALQIFFKQPGVGDFNERDSKFVTVPRGVSSQRITLPVSFETLQVRLDFGSGTNAIQLKSVKVAQTEK